MGPQKMAAKWFQLLMKMKVKLLLLMMMCLQWLNLPKKVMSCLVVIKFCSLTVTLGFKWNMTTACRKLELPEFPQLIRRFLYDQIYPQARVSSFHVSIDACPAFSGKFSVFHCASATFRAPSDPSGPRSMRREYIRATSSWRNGCARNDCVFLNAQPELLGMRGLSVACVFLFFSFFYGSTRYLCALVQWFSTTGDKPDEETGLWVVEPDITQDGRPQLAIIHVESIFRAAHLIPAYRTSEFVRRTLTMHDTLDEFKVFYANKFVDHHAFEIAS